MGWLGHSQFGNTANLYTHLLPQVKQDAADRMDRMFEQPEGSMAVNVAVTGRRRLRNSGARRLIHARRVEPKEGFEPSTDGLRNRCSTTELLRPDAGEAEV